MTTKKHSRARAFVGAAVALLLLAGLGLWVGVVRADLGLSSAIRVEINQTGIDLSVFTPGGAVPASLPVAITTIVSPEPSSRGSVVGDVTSVVTALGGTLNTATGALSGERQQDTAILTDFEGSTSEYVSVLDLKNLDFGSTRGAGVSASDVIRSVAIVQGYYTRSVSDIVEGDSIPVNVSISDLADIDGDGNGIPDADTLAAGDRILVSENGTITIIHSLDSVFRGGATETSVSHAYDTPNGAVEVTLVSPTLAALQTADDFFADFNTARLIVSIGESPVDLLDGPTGVAPLTEFDLVDGTTPLPAPRNLFVRVTIAVANVTVVRGTTPTAWTFVDGPFPGGLDFVGSLGGPAIANALRDGTDVGVYTYDVTFSQTGQSLLANGDEDGWVEVASLELFNTDAADDGADARIVTGTDGDDFIRATFNEASAIFGSNITPRATGGDGGSSSNFCFIATAAYGTPMAKQIGALRGVRDSYMTGNPLGAAFVDTYYRLSPPVAGAVSQSPALKRAVRVALAPVVTLSGWLMASPGAIAAVALLVLIAGARLSRRIVRRAS